MNWDWLDKSLPLRHPSVRPATRGWYVRDWRGVRGLEQRDRNLAVDLWEPVPERGDILFPGVWYVVPDLSDANAQVLPWRELTYVERLVFSMLFTKECLEAACDE